jgi:multiple sugar transport system ATP-binding protein
MAGVSLRGVAKVYDGAAQPAVVDLDLDIHDGEFVVLVGPSGCGKTTALRMIAGLEEASAGEIRLGDRVVNRVPPRDRDIAMVFQNYALYPHLSVAENMGFGLKLRRRPKGEIRERVERAARVLGLTDLLDRRPRELSGGQRQRVAMGRAIVREPQAFLMDEPLSNLDAKLRVQMRAEIARIQRDLKVTTVYVTHDQVEAMTMGDRVAVMRRGRLQQVDVPQVLYERPVNLFVGGFIGSPSMNLVLAEVDRSGDGVVATFGSHRLRLDDKVLDERPALAARLGSTVVLGIRPEELEDDRLAPDAAPDRTIEADVELVEQMGSETYVHFSVDAPPVLTDDTRELARDRADREMAHEGDGESSVMVARVSPRTEIREAGRARLAVDTARLHYFDPDTGAALHAADGHPDTEEL